MDSWELSWDRLESRSCSGFGEREGSDPDSIIEQSFISSSLKVGGLEEVLCLLMGRFGVEVVWEEGF